MQVRVGQLVSTCGGAAWRRGFSASMMIKGLIGELTSIESLKD